MKNNAIVSSDDWLAARKELLKKEKEFTRLRDALTQSRREMPWKRIDKEYRFMGPNGEETLSGLFNDCSQLIIYHFMYGPEWKEGCKICSMVADHYDPLVVHLKHRDVTLTTVSRTSYASIDEFKQRMGWNFKWVSSLDSDFNWDFHVSFTQEDLDSGVAYYNYQQGGKFPVAEAPGISSFYKDPQGDLFHTYSSFGRGLENFLGIYDFLDIVPKGRDENELPYPMAWVRHRDQYGDESVIDPYI